MQHVCNMSCFSLQGVDHEQARPSQPHPVRDSDWGFARLPSLDSMFAAVQGGQEAPFLASLRGSRMFNSPDCVESMAEVYRVSHLIDGLKVRSAHRRRACGVSHARTLRTRMHRVKCMTHQRW